MRRSTMVQRSQLLWQRIWIEAGPYALAWLFRLIKRLSLSLIERADDQSMQGQKNWRN